MVMKIKIPEGYRNTEVGIIPEDWNVKRLEEVSKLSSGTTPSRKLEDRYYSNGNINWVKTTDLNNGDITDTEERVTELALNETCLRKYDIGTVLIAMYGGFNQIGRTGLLKISATVNQALIAIQSQPQTLSPKFLINYLNFRIGYWKNVAISSRKDPNITSRDVKNFSIPLPPILEQKAIAQSLSDVDALITKCDRLITKKRNIKQSTMQQLLTGKKRLPGFGKKQGCKQTEIGIIPEDWKVNTLLEICIKIQDGTHFSPSLGGNDYLYITSKNIGRGVLNISDAERIDSLQHRKIYSRCDVKKGDILLTKDGVNTGNAALNHLDEEFSLLSSVAFLRFDTKKYEPKYFLQQILSSDGQNRIKELMSGNAITRLTLEKIRILQFSVPELDEQKAIAQILSDMDAEIAGLEQKRDKYKAIKQGMMQELLTGKTRLIGIY